MTSVRVIPVSAVLSRVPYGYDFLHMARIRGLHTYMIPCARRRSDPASRHAGAERARAWVCTVQTGNPAHVQKNIPIRYPTEYCRYGYNSY